MSLLNDPRFITILRLVSEARLGSDQTGLFAKFDEIAEEMGDKNTTKQFIRALEDFGYIRCVNKKYEEKFGRELDYKAYQITELGRTHLNSNGGTPTISVGNNVNFAFNSPNVTQAIHIENLSLELQEKIAELQAAIKSEDNTAIKKTFGYIADKSVDVAIAILTQRLML